MKMLVLQLPPTLMLVLLKHKATACCANFLLLCPITAQPSQSGLLECKTQKVCQQNYNFLQNPPPAPLLVKM